jgi:hypothetical protein
MPDRKTYPEFWHACVTEAQAMGHGIERAERLADLAQVPSGSFAILRTPERYAFDESKHPRDEEGKWTDVGGFHVQTDKGDIIRKGGHVGLHGKHVSEVPGFMEQLKKGEHDKPLEQEAEEEAESTGEPPDEEPAEEPGEPAMPSPDELAEAMVDAGKPAEAKAEPEAPAEPAAEAGGEPESSPLAETNKPLNIQQKRNLVASLATSTAPQLVRKMNENRESLGDVATEEAIALVNELDNKFFKGKRTGYVPPEALQFVESSQPESSLKWGPRKHVPERAKNAVARLKDLDDNLKDRSYADIENTIASIAKEFDAAELKEVAREFGVRSGLTSKANTVRKLAERIANRKGQQERGEEIGKIARGE